MLFVEARFLVFFAVVFTVYWALRWNGARKLWLLAASYVFYGAWDWRFLSLILISTVVDLFAGYGVYRATSKGVRRAWLLVSLVANLGLLGFFKYYNFFVESAAVLLSKAGLEVGDGTLEIVLPVGISFYTFQTLSYTIDIYLGNLRPVQATDEGERTVGSPFKNALDLALFVGFFPQLVAGPIVRAVQFLPQLTERRFFQDVPVRRALFIFLVGFVKKACFSDHLAPAIDQVFADPAGHDAASAWLGTVLFYLQLYCDFSGYSDMAIGLAGLLGFKLPDNFAFPYFTRSVGQFWQHWHITLGAWFRHYVYLPLGGNRRSPGRTYANLVIVFLLSGLWHGASWNFVIWGLWHGLFLVIERLGLGAWLERRPVLVTRVYVNLVWITSLTFFRAREFDSAVILLGNMLWPFGAGGDLAIASTWWLAVLGFFIVHWLMFRGFVAAALDRLPDWAFAAFVGAAFAAALPWVATNYTPFLYFQF